MPRTSVVNSAVRILRNEGISEFLYYLNIYITNRIREKIRSGITAIYWSVKFSTDRGAVRRIVDEKSHELLVFTDLLSEIENGDVFFDVGGNRGLYSSLIASAMKGGEVIAFEPSREYVDIFKENVAGFDLKSNVRILNLALSDSNDTIDYFQGSHAIGVDQSDSGEEPTVVTQCRGDDLIKKGEIPPPDVMKIDVDGAELRVLNGLKTTLSSDKPRLIYLEVHTPIAKFKHDIENHGGSISELADLLEKVNYNVEIINSRWNNYHIKARKAA